MESRIRERQNEKVAIDYLAAQRQLYKESNRYELYKWICMVALPVICAVIKSIIIEDVVLNIITYMIPILSFVLSYYIGEQSKILRRMAAEIQQHFDLYVYQMEWNTLLFGKKQDVTNLVAEKSEVLSKSEREKLRNWYELDEKKHSNEEEIPVCQLENIKWDGNLRKRYKVWNCIIIGIISIGILLLGIIKEETVPMLLGRIWIIAPLLKWLWDVVQQLDFNIKSLEDLDSRMGMLDNPNMYDLQMIQNMIYEHRKTCLKIPDWFYNLFKNKDQEKAKRRASLNVEKKI